MTIVSPHQKKSIKVLIAIFLSLATGSMAFAGIILYNQLVDLRHDVAQAGDDLREQEVFNAELKNKLYALTDPQNPEAFLANRGLIRDNNPRYGSKQVSIARAN